MAVNWVPSKNVQSGFIINLARERKGLLRLQPDIRTAIRALPPGSRERFISERRLRPLTRPWGRQLAELGWLLRRTA